MSTYLEDALINATLRNTSYTTPTTVYAALFTADGGLEGGTLTNEIATGSYTRISITFGAPSDGATDNTVSVTFTAATANWGTITHMAICDASTSGNVLYHAALTVAKTVQTGDTFKFDAGDLDVTLA